jgi:hypothetical protein
LSALSISIQVMLVPNDLDRPQLRGRSAKTVDKRSIFSGVAPQRRDNRSASVLPLTREIALTPMLLARFHKLRDHGVRRSCIRTAEDFRSAKQAKNALLYRSSGER